MTVFQLACLDAMGWTIEQLADLEQLRGTAFFEPNAPLCTDVEPRAPSCTSEPSQTSQEKRVARVREKLELERRLPRARHNGHAHDCGCSSACCVVARAVSASRGR